MVTQLLRKTLTLPSSDRTTKVSDIETEDDSAKSHSMPIVTI